jgi:hypothetical protein
MIQNVLQIRDSTAALAGAMTQEGYAALSARGLCALASLRQPSLDAMRPFWGRLPADEYLRDGGHYRRRRHSCWVMNVRAGVLQPVPRRAHWQPVEYNALHGGIERWYEPIEAALCEMPAWRTLLLSLGQCFAGVRRSDTWYIEAHQFRIDTTGGIGRPTPEGAHRDGVDFVSVTVVDRSGVKGGETRVFEADGPHGLRFTMSEPWTTLLLDDERVIHETTPIQPIAEEGYRDTLVLTYRSGGFQGPVTS